MKRYSLIILAFALLLGFTQCKPEPENNPDDSRMELRFEVPLNNGAKTDWSDFFMIDDNGTGFIKNDIKWVDGETLYLALPNHVLTTTNWGTSTYEKNFDATIITLEGSIDEEGGTITFSGGIYSDESSILSIVGPDYTYTVYYLGSGSNVERISEVNGISCEGYEMYFDSQTGNKLDLNNVHFASIDVRLVAKMKDGKPYIEIEPVGSNYNFTTQTAICYLDLVGEKGLTGTAVKENAVRFYCLNDDDAEHIANNEDYKSYTTEFFTKDNTGITLTGTPSKESFIVIPPSDDAGMTLECDKGTYSFSNRIIANTVYYGKGVENNKIEPLPWTPNP